MNELNILKLKQELLCTNYDKLKTEYNKLKVAKKNQTNKVDKLQANPSDLEKKSNAESIKLDAIHQ